MPFTLTLTLALALHPNPNLDLSTATLAYIDSFPKLDAVAPVMVVVQPPAHSPSTLLDNGAFERFSQRLNDTVYAYPPLATGNLNPNTNT